MCASRTFAISVLSSCNSNGVRKAQDKVARQISPGSSHGKNVLKMYEFLRETGVCSKSLTTVAYAGCQIPTLSQPSTRMYLSRSPAASQKPTSSQYAFPGGRKHQEGLQEYRNQRKPVMSDRQNLQCKRTRAEALPRVSARIRRNTFGKPALCGSLLHVSLPLPTSGTTIACQPSSW